MYMPRHFNNNDSETIHTLIRSNPLATLVIASEQGFEINHIPFVLDLEKQSPTRLRAHIPRQNQLSELATESVNCVAIFQGAQGYISPSWYATKKEHGKVVPTWNYQIVHVHGTLQINENKDWILQQLNDLTHLNESPRQVPWAVSDAPDDFIERQVTALVGLDLQITRIDAKTKASQNQPPINQSSVLTALNKEQPDSELERMMLDVLGKK